MKVTNISEKIVAINNVSLMPGDEQDFKKEVVEVPGVKVLADLGFIKIEKGADKTVKAEAVVEEETAAVVPEEVEKPKRTRKKAEETE